MKQFAVIGLGTFGASIARALFQMEQEVLAIDSDPDLVDDIKDDVTQAIQADMDNEEVLRSLGLHNFDAVIVAIGKDIQTSILVSLLCKDMGVQCLVARARNDLHAKVLSKIGVDKVIFPERDTGMRLAHSLVTSNILDVIELSEDYSLVELAVPEAWSGKTLKELNMRVIYGLNAIAVERGEPWLQYYGGAISSEWTFPKIWQVLEEAPYIYEKAEKFIECGDWIVWTLTGTPTRGGCHEGYKSMYTDDGYPAPDFFRALDPRLENVISEKCSDPVLSPGQRAGTLTPEWAKTLGLNPGIAVAVSVPDAHVASPAMRVGKIGRLLAIMGTSTCHLLVSDKLVPVPGICGAVKDGVLPGFYGYEAGQGCVGDHFAWFTENCTPISYHEEALSRGMTDIQLLSEKADALRPGESGILALDWWNGNRSILVDTDLSGMFIGMTLTTKPEELFRALLEATAFGTRMIVENYREHGIEVNEYIAAGGIAKKAPGMMQIYADVTGMEIHVASSTQGPALGSAIYAACAAGSECGGYDSIAEASERMGTVYEKTYTPIPENKAVYDKLYAEYKLLHDYFGRGENNVMKRLRDLKAEIRK